MYKWYAHNWTLIGQATDALPRAYYGQGIGRIWLSHINCRGTEWSIESCPHLGWGVHSCFHSEDVGIRCTLSSDTPGIRMHVTPFCDSQPINMTYS